MAIFVDDTMLYKVVEIVLGVSSQWVKQEKNGKKECCVSKMCGVESNK